MGYEDFDIMCQSSWNLMMYDDIVNTLIERCIVLEKTFFDKKEIVVLDAGCGAGGMSYALLNNIPVSNLFLLDLRKEGLQIAKERIIGKYINTKVKCVESDVENIPLEDSTVDMIISRGSIRFWKNQLVALAELRRVLKTGGIMYIGGGRGSTQFQENRKHNDPDWSENGFDKHFKSHKNHGAKMLEDIEYEKLFHNWKDDFIIYNQFGDGHWLSVIKR